MGRSFASGGLVGWFVEVCGGNTYAKDGLFAEEGEFASIGVGEVGDVLMDLMFGVGHDLWESGAMFQGSASTILRI